MKNNFYIILILTSSFLFKSCSNSNNKKHSSNQKTTSKKEIAITKDTITTPQKKDTIQYIDTCHWDSYLSKQGLINIKDSIPNIIVDLKYSTEDNFMQKDMYGCLNNCYLQPDVAKKLKTAQEQLKSRDSTLSLLVFDGVRPRSVQQYMWDILDMPLEEKVKFVSNPKRGSLHNFGAAVDISIFNIKDSCELDMGTPYDYIGALAWPIREKANLEEGMLTQEQIDNRKLLRYAMAKGGFFNIQTEWWHFNSCYRDSAKIKYSIIE